MNAQSTRLSSSFWKSPKLTLADGKKLYRAAFGLKALQNVNDKGALAKRASNPPVHVNWEAVTNPSEPLDSTFSAEEREFYKVFRDLVRKGRINPAEWNAEEGTQSHVPGLGLSATEISLEVAELGGSTPATNAAAHTSPTLPRKLYVQVVQTNKARSQTVLEGFKGFLVEDEGEMVETPLLVACLLDKIMFSFTHTLKLGVRVESFFDMEGDENPVTWFAKLVKVDHSSGAPSSGFETLVEGKVYCYRGVEYEVTSGTVAVFPYERDASSSRVQIFAEEWVPESVLEDAAAHAKAQKKMQQDDEKRKRDRCALGYLHAEFHSHNTTQIIRRLHEEKSAKKLIKLTFQDMTAVASFKAKIRKRFRSRHSDQPTIPWINPDPGFQGQLTQVENLLKESTTFPEDHQLCKFYGFGSSWLSNLNYCSLVIDEIEENGSDELRTQLENWIQEGMVDKGVLSGLDGDTSEDIDDATMLVQGADSWKNTMKLILQTAHQKGLVMG
ncbi:hypothetical protein FRC01_013640 [Tulasnella sp. 417]|nr:hypothetical protein FRC01_013640 [Tulasnella sp. 417]